MFMRLHATITNERGATASKGGNGHLTIELQHQNEKIGTILVSLEDSLVGIEQYAEIHLVKIKRVINIIPNKGKN